MIIFMGWIWMFFIVLSIISAMFSGQTNALSGAILDGAQQGVTLAISLAGPICLWSGISKVMEKTRLSDKLTKLSSPLLRKLFPVSWQDKETRDALCGNLSANLLGLGNAATPLGVKAVQSMAARSNGFASDELCRLVVLNTASVQLLPTTIAAVRTGLGAAEPFDILPAVWLTSVCSVSAGLLAARFFSKWV